MFPFEKLCRVYGLEDVDRPDRPLVLEDVSLS